jgi:hypothetical protein
MNVKETASKCKSRRKRTRGALQEAHHHTHQATGAAAARFHRRPPFVSAVSNRGADPGRQSNTTPAATHCATYHRLILCTPEFRSTTSLLLHLPRPCRPFAYSGGAVPEPAGAPYPPSPLVTASGPTTAGSASGSAVAGRGIPRGSTRARARPRIGTT